VPKPPAREDLVAALHLQDPAAQPAQDVLAQLARAVGDALEAGAAPDRTALKLACRGLAQELAARVPGRTVELRIPPYAAVQCVPGPRHTRGTPPNVVEVQPAAWVLLADGRLSWEDAAADGRLLASGERAALLARELPLLGE